MLKLYGVVLSSIILLGTYAYFLVLLHSYLFAVALILLVSVGVLPILGVAYVTIIVLQRLMRKQHTEIGPQGSIIYSSFGYQVIRPLTPKSSGTKKEMIQTVPPVELESPRDFTEKEAKWRGIVSGTSSVNGNQLGNHTGTDHIEHNETSFESGSDEDSPYRIPEPQGTVSVNDIIAKGLELGISKRTIAMMVGMHGRRYSEFKERIRDLSIE